MADLAKQLTERMGVRLWRPGMRGHMDDSSYFFRVVASDEHCDPYVNTEPKDVVAGSLPDLDDPATVGCLHALAEEVCGESVDLERMSERDYSAQRWFACCSRPEVGRGDTKGEALARLILERAG